MRRNQDVDPNGRLLHALVKRALASSRMPASSLLLEIAAGLLLILAGLYSVGAPIPAWGWTLVGLGMAAVFGSALFYNTHRHRKAFHYVEQAYQLCRLMDVPAASLHLDECLRDRNCPEPARAMGLVELGHICLAANQPLLAETAFEAAMKRRAALSADWLCRAEVGLAEAKLRNEQLTDANATISRLLTRRLPQPWHSRVSLLTCLQRLYMGHTQDIAARSNELWHEFREHLGVEAGYGYGLLAAALDRCGQAAKALKYWSDATLLIRPERLVQRYPELRALAAKYGASAWPW